MKEGDKEGREGEREGDELMELLLGIFFALSLVERGRQRPLVCGHHHPAGKPRRCKKLTPPHCLLESLHVHFWGMATGLLLPKSDDMKD